MKARTEKWSRRWLFLAAIMGASIGGVGGHCWWAILQVMGGVVLDGGVPAVQNASQALLSYVRAVAFFGGLGAATGLALAGFVLAMVRGVIKADRADRSWSLTLAKLGVTSALVVAFTILVLKLMKPW